MGTYEVDLSDVPGLGLLPSRVTISSRAAEPISNFTSR